jgi:hypothetical protein
MESHGPYVGLGGNGWPSLNHWGSINTAKYAPANPSPLPGSFGTPLRSGVAETGWFKSEFGCVGWSSFESMSAQLSGLDQWSLHSAASFYRNWPVDNVVISLFCGEIGSHSLACDLNQTGELPFKAQLYFSQLGQALIQVRQIQEWRASNNFGIML